MAAPPESVSRVRGLAPEQLQRLIDRLQRGRESGAQRIGRKERGTGPIPLSYGQERLWFLDRLEPGSAAYNIPVAVELRGHLRTPALAAALGEVVRRHESLRTRFEVLDGLPAQRIDAALEIGLPLIDLAALPAEVGREESVRQTAHHGGQPFDLERGPLLRASLIRLAPDCHLFLLALHHIVADGWSVRVMVREVAALYETAVLGRPSPLPELPIQYADFASWQRRTVAGAQEREIAYWMERLSGEIAPLGLPADHPRPAVQTYRGGRVQRALGSQLSHQVRALSSAEGATPFMALLTTFSLLLQRLSGQDDLVIGTPVAGRRRIETEGLIGFFLNTLALRVDLGGDPCFRELLARVRDVTVGAFSHQDVPFEALLARLRQERDPSRTALFQVLFNMLNFPCSEVHLPDLTLQVVSPPEVLSKFDLTLYVDEEANGFVLDLVYNASLFSEARMAGLLEQLACLLAQAVERPEMRIGELSLVTTGARAFLPDLGEELTAAWEGSVCERLSAHARRAPGRIALADAHGCWTYEELDAASDRVCLDLRTAGIAIEDPVAIYAHRSAPLVAAVLGILKAGAAFLILDPAYPTARLLACLRSAAPRGWIEIAAAGPPPPELADHLAATSPLCRISLPAGPLSWRPGGAPGVLADPDRLAYIAFTSGSTGEPKAIAGSQRPLSHFCDWHARRFGLGPEDRFSALSGLAHDPLLRDLFAPLWVGATLCLPPPRVLMESEALARWLREERITVAHLTPGLAQLLAAAEESAATRQPAAIESLRYAFFGGDRLSLRDVRRLRWLAPRVACVSYYGATETPQAMGWASAEPEAPGPEAVPLGRGIPGVQLLVLDRRGRLAGIGELGEIAIRSPYLARGYLDPAATAERFTPDPGADAGGRVYRTGDLGRYLPGGEVAFAGRADRQVKVRGFRVEPGEVEAALTALPGVREAVVLALEHGGDHRLVAYVVPVGEGEVTAGNLRDGLRRRLPAYLVPSETVILEAIPLTPNGKVDRRALSRLQPRVESAAAAPESALEQEIAAVWREILGVEQVGVEDNFFDVGGHSLLLARLHARLQTLLGRDISLIDLFSYPTVRAQAEHLGRSAPAVERDVRSQGEASPRERTADSRRIAVVGMAGRFPGARDLEEFWENLCGGVDSISTFTDEDLAAAGVAPEMIAHPRYVKAGGVLADEALFDSRFFDYSPREAALLDPQHRIFLECAWEALENAGYDSARYPGAIGVFAGVNFSSYFLNNLYTNRGLLQEVGGRQAILGVNHDYLATRVSYKLGLKGPSLTVQTACSTSLVATHLACQSLLSGECSIALAGGGAIKTPQKSGYLYQDGGVDSASGRCRAFDAGADGTVWGNGVGVVVLKRLADALADGDTIHGVILGSAINNDGAGRVGFTAPSIEGQAEVISTAQAVAGVEPESIGYVECHGSATSLGDPIEVTALAKAFGPTVKKRFCPIGSVKTNIGHLGAAAGVAGLIKTLLALEHRHIPPSLHFAEPNPNIDFESSPFYVNTRLAEWQRGGVPRRAGVSSFGLGGTNAHVVLEEAPEAPVAVASGRAQLLVLSAKSQGALEVAAKHLAKWLDRHPDASLADVAYTLQVGRRAFPHRQALVCDGIVEAREALMGQASQSSRAESEPRRTVAFLLPGLGDHYPGMAWGLYQDEPRFQAELDRCAGLFEERLGIDLRRVIFAGERSERTEGLDLRRMVGRSQPIVGELSRTLYAQPAVFAVGYALARLWESWGVRPKALLGYSLGEYLAACLAGVFSLEDAVLLVSARARRIEELPAGSMLAVPLAEQETRRWLTGNLCLAAVNGQHLSVVSGPPAEVESLAGRLAAAGTLSRRLPTTHAFHSRMMEPIAPALLEALRQVRLSPPRIPYISNVTGTWIETHEAMDPEYWVRHLCGPVRFADGLSSLAVEPSLVLVEVGPGQGLSALALQQAGTGEEPKVAVSSLPHADDRRPDRQVMLRSVARLWLAGVEIDWENLHAGERRRRIPLPVYPFERQHFWIPPAKEADASSRPASATGKIPDMADWFHIPSWKRITRLGQIEEPKGTWLILLDQQGVGLRLAEHLKVHGCDVLLASAGERFERIGPRLFTLSPRNPGDYDALLLEMQQGPHKIVHLWSLGQAPAKSSIDRFEAMQAIGFYSLIYLAQALGRRDPTCRLEICAVTDGLCAVEREDRLQPEKATLLGPARVIPQEHPQIICRVIDVDLRESSETLASRLLSDLTGVEDEPLLARRGPYCWAPLIEQLRLPATGRSLARLQETGTYLITGGFGGIGLALAKYLARTVKARIVLVGRSSLPERSDWGTYRAEGGEVGRRIREIQDLEGSGTEVLTLAADLADEKQMRSAIEKIRERFGRIDGVFHLAGVPGGGLIQLKTPENAAAVLAPKAIGALVLEELLRDAPPDFLVLFSSINAISGGIGQVDYCAANAFLDAFAHHRQMRGYPTTVINWCGWQWDPWTDEMIQDHNLRSHVHQQRQIYGLTFEEGMEALQRVLASGLTQAIVFTGDLQATIGRRRSLTDLLQELPSAASALASADHRRPDLGPPYLAPRDEVELRLAALWQELLGIEKIGVHDNFFQLGGHSLLGLQLFSRVQESFKVELSLADLFEAPTIAELGAAISGKREHLTVERLPEIRPAENADAQTFLVDVQQLSDLEVDDLLLRVLQEHSGGSQ